MGEVRYANIYETPSGQQLGRLFRTQKDADFARQAEEFYGIRTLYRINLRAK